MYSSEIKLMRGRYIRMYCRGMQTRSLFLSGFIIVKKKKRIKIIKKIRELISFENEFAFFFISPKPK